VTRNTLIDFFEDFARHEEPFVVHDDGYRVREITYRELADASRAFAASLSARGIGPDDKVVIWSENRPEWLVALWGCLLARVVLVPVDYRASADLVMRISQIVEAKAVLVGAEVEPPATLTGSVWQLRDIDIGSGARALGPSSHIGPRPMAQGPSSSIGQRPEAQAPSSSMGPGPGALGLSGSTLAEIIFTSGATSDPKGVTITHRNVLANIIPIEREIAKYRRYEKPFHPIRFLNLLPLSHMFGQSMATFVPPMLGATVVFSHGYSPVEILRQIRTRRISVLVCVPKVLDVLREHVERVVPIAAEADVLAGKHFLRRWWRYRAVHRLFGWKFWCVICGAAPLEPALEAFWRKLGFLVVQGYGLTETAPIVTLNHPFKAARGTVGTPIGGVEVKIADDGEILVRGENVTSGYYRAAGADAETVAEQTAAFRDGWFHTGDIGELDKNGHLLIKGRKKEMIVTPQGLNVFPEDVERALVAQPGVADAGVVGVQVDGEERIHAVIVPKPGADVQAAIRSANAALEDHQRVWSSSIWPGDALPRTEGTQKLKRRELQRWASGEQTGAAVPAGGSATVEDVVARFVAGRALAPETTLDELGLSSLVRVELMMALEEVFHTTLDETAMTSAKTIGDLKTLVGSGVPDKQVRSSNVELRTSRERSEREEPINFPSWNRSRPIWLLRRLSLPTWILPLARPFLQMKVDGLEHLAKIDGPVIFASNHQSHMDTPAIMRALPPRWRYWLAPAMAKEFFRAHFYPKEVGRKAWFTNTLNYLGSTIFFNAFPLPQREAGTRQTLRYIGEVTAGGYSVLIFPEGKRNPEGRMSPFRPGVGMIASRLDVPVVPVRLEGLDQVLDPHWKWPKRGPVRVAFGAPLRLSGDDYPGLTQQVEDAVKAL
jgi:long-chain acyl-CoA synthetase